MTILKSVLFLLLSLSLTVRSWAVGTEFICKIEVGAATAAEDFTNISSWIATIDNADSGTADYSDGDEMVFSISSKTGTMLSTYAVQLYNAAQDTDLGVSGTLVYVNVANTQCVITDVSNTGYAFASGMNWVNSVGTNYVTISDAGDTQPTMVLEMKQVSGSDPGGDFGETLLFTTSNRLVLRAEAGSEIDGSPGSGVLMQPGSFQSLDVGDQVCRIEGIEIDKQDETNANVHCVRTSGTAADIEMERCLIYDTGGTTADGFFVASASSVKISNTIFADCGDHGFASGFDSMTVTLHNCTSVGNGDHGFSVSSSTGTQIARNCLAGQNGTDYSSGWETGTSYNADEDSSAPGTNADSGNTFTFADSANGDYRLASGDEISGTDLTSSDPAVTLDIEGETRTNWHRGADELISASTFKPKVMIF